ncbi:MAG TPA: glycerol-3-phosphate 1-O-acyltransferase PlsY [Candidatus Binatia bacterium]|nr:glycerol-3-phosphate 1-O-acyltransferase PlsY [Candidatus Binatia bacterium]
MLEFLTKILLAYVLGTCMGGFVMGRLRGGVDLRASGSGNVGATNALRTQGLAFGLAVLAIDMAKGVIAAGVLPELPWPGPGAWPAWLSGGRTALACACGLAVALGHIYPAWFGFRGGKGAATLVGVYLALLPEAMPWMVAAFLLVLLLTGYVGLATVTGAATALLYVTCFSAQGIFSTPGTFALAAALLVAFTHRANLLRVWNGSEHRFEKVLAWKRWLGR